mmetsp:Transcript_83101/g.254010  ORF Transcript_83101/g.254010 Transcript_83101/m.254010 type:complete len:257 (-) Transcript_83101:17-787(-)
MAFDRDTCCLLVPLSYGVGLIAMAAFVSACVALVALATGDIRLMPNGYDTRLLYVPSVVTAFGLIFGFVGLLGALDGKRDWLRVFVGFLQAKLFTMAVVAAADFWALRRCEALDRAADQNHFLDVLAEGGLCPYARWAFLVGAALDFSVWAYFTHATWRLANGTDIDRSSISITFAGEAVTCEERWKLYGVRDPRAEMDRAAGARKEWRAQAKKQAEMDAERAEVEDLNAAAHPRFYGGVATYGPDGMVASRGYMP